MVGLGAFPFLVEVDDDESLLGAEEYPSVFQDDGTVDAETSCSAGVEFVRIDGVLLSFKVDSVYALVSSDYDLPVVQ